MAAAAPAMHLRAQHAPAAVRGGADGVVERLIEAGPASAAVELGGRGEQRQVAAGAVVHAGPILLVERAGEGALGAVLAQHIVLLGREQLLPLLVGLGDLEGLGGGGGLCLSSPGEARRGGEACGRYAGEHEIATAEHLALSPLACCL